jgi:hypothetical protein
VAIAGEQANALPVSLDDQSIAIMFDLVKPIPGRLEPLWRGSGYKVRTHSYAFELAKWGQEFAMARIRD